MGAFRSWVLGLRNLTRSASSTGDGGYPGIVGLRQHIGSTDWPLETAVLNILTYGLDEPLGSRADTLEPDENGVMWWTGTPPESWVRY